MNLQNPENLKRNEIKRQRLQNLDNVELNVELIISKHLKNVKLKELITIELEDLVSLEKSENLKSKKLKVSECRTQAMQNLENDNLECKTGNLKLQNWRNVCARRTLKT